MAKRKSDQPNSESPNPTDSPSDKIASQPDDGASPPADMATIASPDLVPPQAEQAPARAGIAIAAAVGTTGGAMATAEIARLWGGDSPAPVASTEESRALKESIARITADVAALKAAVDTSGRSANSQLVKLGDRLDRFERAQAEPAAKLAKLAEAIDRIERRPPGASAAAPAP